MTNQTKTTIIDFDYMIYASILALVISFNLYLTRIAFYIHNTLRDKTLPFTICIIFTLIILAIRLKKRWLLYSIAIFFSLYALSENIVIKILGSPYVFEDVVALASVSGVAFRYNLLPDIYGIMNVILLIISLCIVKKITKTNYKEANKTNLNVLILFLLSANIISYHYATGALNASVQEYRMDSQFHYASCGGILYQLTQLNTEETFPENYDPDVVIEKIQEYKKDPKPTKMPNVITILSESMYDFSHLKETDYTENPLAFYNSLSDNAIKGYVRVSQFGGRTGNAEFSFLTMGFNPFFQIKYPFISGLNVNGYSFAKYLKNVGYRTIAFYPGTASSYNRSEAYKILGFDKSYFDRDMVDKYGKENIEMINENVSDQSFVKMLIDLYEENRNKDDKPLFMHTVSIQSHSPYKVEGDVLVTDRTEDNPELDAYLTCLKETDNSIKTLIEYFQNVDEPTMIFIYGDHAPLIGDLFDPYFEEENNAIFETPYLLWANFDIDTKQKEEIFALQYAQIMISEKAGIPLSGEEHLLKEIQKEYPTLSFTEYGTDLKNEADTPGTILNLYRDYSYMQIRQNIQ